jgi:hypothetical protein
MLSRHVCRELHLLKGKIVPKDRTTATITIVAVIAIVIMVVALLTAPPNRAVVTPTPVGTAVAQSTAAPDPTAVALATQAVGSDVQTTASGLKYRVITEGTGAKPTATDTVTVNYRGIFLDGTEFDSSYSRNQPATFPLNQVISGWTEGVQLMSVGSKYVFTIPADLAYGAAGRQGIPPNSTLVFEIELLDIPSQANAPTAAPIQATSAPDVTQESAPATVESDATAEATVAS